MNLKEFMEHLKEQIELQPGVGDLPMYLSKDGEGNEFRPFCGDFDIMIGEEIEQDDLEKVAVFWPDW